MYNVHMKRVTASQARRNWFRLLDEVAAGEAVVIERKGVRVVLRRQEEQPAVPDYTGLLSVPEVERADEWRWRWGEEGELRPADDESPAS